MTKSKKRRNQITCTCQAYDFPHRLDSGQCRRFYNAEPIEPRERDSVESLGLRSLFAPDNRQYVQF